MFCCIILYYNLSFFNLPSLYVLLRCRQIHPFVVYLGLIHSFLNSSSLFLASLLVFEFFALSSPCRPHNPSIFFSSSLCSIYTFLISPISFLSSLPSLSGILASSPLPPSPSLIVLLHVLSQTLSSCMPSFNLHLNNLTLVIHHSFFSALSSFFFFIPHFLAALCVYSPSLLPLLPCSPPFLFSDLFFSPPFLISFLPLTVTQK